MANVKILEMKQGIIDEIGEKIKNSNSFIAFNYHGLSVSDTNELRRILKESGSEFKIYKNTLVKRALEANKIDLGTTLEGPKAFAFGEDQVAPIKTLSDFAKNHPALVLKVGIIDGEKADQAKLAEYATLPSRDGLLTMLAGGMMGIARDLSICLDLYSQQKEEN